MAHINVTLRMPAELVAKIDAVAARMAAETGLRIDRSQVIRQALAKAVEGEKPKAAKK